MIYNPINNTYSETPYTVYKPSPVTFKSNLYDNIEIPEAINMTSSGIPIFDYNLPDKKEKALEIRERVTPVDWETMNIEGFNSTSPLFNNSNSSKKHDIPVTNDSKSLSKIIDEVSLEKGYENLKNPEIKNLLMLQAKRESGFNSKAKSNTSTASGYFLFIDSTRKRFSNVNKNEFLNDPKELVRTAYKLLEEIHNSPNAKKLLAKGYNLALITALGWWYPDSMRMVLNGQLNYSKGGYSIKKALNDYK